MEGAHEEVREQGRMIIVIEELGAHCLYEKVIYDA